MTSERIRLVNLEAGADFGRVPDGFAPVQSRVSPTLTGAVRDEEHGLPWRPRPPLALNSPRYKKYRLSDAIDPDEILQANGGPRSPVFRESSARQGNRFLLCLKACVCSPCVFIGFAARGIRNAIFRSPPPQPRTIKVPIWEHERKKRRKLFPRNAVYNQKYSVLSFIPEILYEQFKFFFNLYFLLVALSQFVPSLQVGYLFTYFAPLAFVLFVTISKEANDDLKRRKRDSEANSQAYDVLTVSTGGYVLKPSSALIVGDIVRVRKDQRLPADLVLLRTHDSTGTCFVRTDQLDGETDWKLKIAVPSTQHLASDDALCELEAEVYADPPSKDIHSFCGNFSLQSAQHTDPLTVDNVLWMNTVLASDTIVGCVIYTGRETRAMMNTNQPEVKFGLLDSELNRLSKILFAVTCVLSFTMVYFSGFHGYWTINLVRFLILFSSIIPISLRVNLDMGKTFYAREIMRDEEIPDTIVRTSTIPEELGRIEFLLSDKTGTLTRNEMELRKVHIGTMLFAVDTFDELREQVATAVAASVAAQGNKRLHGKARDMSTRARDLVFGLALCHNVTPLISETDGSVSYQAASPDEIALVKWAHSMDVSLSFRDVESIKLSLPGGHGEASFEIIEVFPFTSESKRMGIVLRDLENDEITFYQKGADVIMTKLVQYNDWLEEECENMSREGLRTLVIARKRLSAETYERFKAAYREARTALQNRAEQTQAVVSRFLENELEILGLTGVEDKLQEDIRTTLESLRNAGIKVWMLTGDKVETATCIALSSRLVSRQQTIHTITKLKSPLEAQEALERLSNVVNGALVIDGESLAFCLTHCLANFLTLATRLPAVVCCRCSPTQKAQVTELIKKHTGKRVCAIGDGGNDVSMIQAAHVGVGLEGKEGKQASLAADFSMTQFSHLNRLLLWHGRNSYQRSAKLAQFVIHRGLIISIMQAVYSAIFYFAPLALYQGMLLVGYTTVYTMAPVFSLVLDRDLSPALVILFPELYKDLVKGRLLSYKIFFFWLTVSVYQGGAIMMLALLLFDRDFVHVVSISFTALVFNELLMVALEIVTWHRYMVYAQVLTIIIYLGSMAVLPEFDLQFILTLGYIWRVLAITAISSAPLFIIKRLRHHFAPPSYQKLMAHH